MTEALILAKKALSENEFPVGCVIACDGDIVAKGYRTHSGGQSPNETDHAEINALRRLPRNLLRRKNAPLTVFITMEPCLMCFGALLLSGIYNIVYAYEDVMGGGTRIDLTGLSPLYHMQNINIVSNIMRENSLKLFKDFFKNPDNHYWEESLLARYTLSQS